jgi:hypothetical protein
MRTRLLPITIRLLAMAPGPARAEQIVVFRHGEQPAGGYGQLTCRGLNRALALPARYEREVRRSPTRGAPQA